jgi:hypothetical protein
MGWWEGENEGDVIGDGPADTLSLAFKEINRLQGRTLTLNDALASVLQALQLNPRALVEDPDPPVTALKAELNDGQTVVSTATPASKDNRPIKVLHQALVDIVTEYQDMEDHRKPRLREILETMAFILGPDDQDFVVTPNGSGVRRITPIR